MEEMRQNACLMTTSLDDDGNTVLTYVPLNIDYSVVEFFLKNGTCTNNLAVSFNLEESADKFWQGMWGRLEESCE